MTEEQLIRLMSAFNGGQQQQQFNPMDLMPLLQTPPSRRLGMGGQEITEDNPMGHAGGNPFTNGFFKGMADRQAIETERLGVPGFSSLSPGQQVGALGTNPRPDYAAGAVGASPQSWLPQSNTQPFQIPGVGPAPAGGTPEAGAWMDLLGQQNAAMMKPGGASGFWSALGRKPNRPVMPRGFMGMPVGR